MKRTNLTHLMARATVVLVVMFCFLGEAKASDVGLYGTWLESYGNSEMEVIRALRSVITINLSDAKHLVESAPCYVLENVTQEEAQACADALNAAGATAFAKTMNSKLLPYEYGFENNDLEGEGWSLVDCNNDTKVQKGLTITGNCTFVFCASNNSPQYLISPELVDRTSIRMSFLYRAGNPIYLETFQVGYSTTTNDISAFTWYDEITTNSGGHELYQKNFPAGTKYVAVRYNTKDKVALFLDDFKFTEAPAPKTLPYEYGFENNDLEGEGWSLFNCDSQTSIYQDDIFLGNYGFDFCFNTNPPQYLVSPELICNTEMKLSFWYRAGHEYYPETFQVGYSTTTDHISAFIWGDEITASNTEWTEFQNTFPAGTKYVAVKLNSNDQFKLSLDDFTFKSYEAPAPKTLPYEYGFENNDLEGEGWSLVNCKTNSKIYDFSSVSFSGDCLFEFVRSINPPQYLISPELVGSTKMSVSFWYRNIDADYPETFQVGYSTTTDDVSAFTWGDEITASNKEWTQYQNIFPAGTKYVAVRFNSNDTDGDLYLDNFKFTEAIAPTPKSLPYEYGFENEDLYEEGWSLVNCDDLTLISSSPDNTSSGNYRFDFRYNTNPPQYLISPELVVSTKMNVSFWYTNIDENYPETFQVGYSTTTNDVSAFTWGDEITASNMKYQWSQYQNTFPAGTKYVAVKLNSYDQFILSLDDFSFTEAAGLKGDVNLDGSVDISDVVLMVNYILGNDALVNVPLYGDMNDDNSVDISDVVALVNIILVNN